jgi:hypothetical protein
MNCKSVGCECDTNHSSGMCSKHPKAVKKIPAESIRELSKIHLDSYANFCDALVMLAKKGDFGDDPILRLSANVVHKELIFKF